MTQKKPKKFKDKKEYDRFVKTAKKLQEEGAEKNFEKACRAILKEKP
jgi:hypothetical protein